MKTKKSVAFILILAMMIASVSVLAAFNVGAADNKGIVAIDASATTVKVGGVDYTVLRTLTVGQVLNGNYILANDIDMQGTVESEKGYLVMFEGGILDGNGYSIHNYSLIPTEKTNVSTFGVKTGSSDPTSTVEIKNLTLGTAQKAITITAPDNKNASAGAFISYNGDRKVSLKLNNLTAYVNITTYDGWVGGIIGNDCAASEIVNCNVYGSLKKTTADQTKENPIGGIVGILNKAANHTIKNCVNNAEISAPNGSTHAGGIVGTAQGDAGGKTVIENCVNYGDVTNAGQGKGGASGLVGNRQGASELTIKYCVNFGKISSTGRRAAGFIERQTATEVTLIESCINLGEIVGGPNGGAGFVGYTEKATLTLKKNASFGKVSAGVPIGPMAQAGGTGADCADNVMIANYTCTSDSANFNLMWEGCELNKKGALAYIDTNFASVFSSELIAEIKAVIEKNVPADPEESTSTTENTDTSNTTSSTTTENPDETTTAATTEATTTAAEESGCGSAYGGSIVMLVAVFGVAALCITRKKIRE